VSKAAPITRSVILFIGFLGRKVCMRVEAVGWVVVCRRAGAKYQKRQPNISYICHFEMAVVEFSRCLEKPH
jgi:hypothetical protein